ncbi:transporter [Sphingobium sp. AP49]|uniref:hypothetical protein n=1 Tax=Sphingobium sp. AP49 TaxID=1144307 RepID=UPI00026EDAE0|nr:hypothetical protein [Sphingobium sp. AP49]WHO37445.1 transporter [Sphingobium sp. AP49]
MAEGETPEDIWQVINERRRLMRANLRAGDPTLSVRNEMLRRMKAQKQTRQDDDF